MAGVQAKAPTGTTGEWAKECGHSLKRHLHVTRLHSPLPTPAGLNLTLLPTFHPLSGPTPRGRASPQLLNHPVHTNLVGPRGLGRAGGGASGGDAAVAMGTRRLLWLWNRSLSCSPPPSSPLPACPLRALSLRARWKKQGWRKRGRGCGLRAGIGPARPKPRPLRRRRRNREGQGQAQSRTWPAADRAPRPTAQTRTARSAPVPAPRDLSPAGDLGASAAPAGSGPGPFSLLRRHYRRRRRRHRRGRLSRCRHLRPRSDRDPSLGLDLSPDPAHSPTNLARGPGPGPGGPAVGTMLPSSIQISGEPLSGAEVRDICRGLRDNAVRLLSLRGCRLCDRDFGRICRALAGATSLAQLNLNLGVVSSPSRIKQLAEALRTNRSIQSLL